MGAYSPYYVQSYSKGVIKITVSAKAEKGAVMHPNLERAKEAMKAEKLTCVLTEGGVMFKSKDKGVQPLLDWMNSGNNYMSYMIADKVIGRAAAFIDIAMGIREVYAEVMSEGAKTLLENNHVVVNYDTLVPEILNADKTDLCPLEKAVEGIENAAEALMPIELALIRMNG